MHFRLSIFMLFIVALILCVPAYAGNNVNITAEFGTEALDGSTQYELKFTVPSDTLLEYGHSRLKYPFTLYLAGATIGAEYRGFDANLGFWSDYTYDKSHIMKDFDWGTTSSNEYIQIAIGHSIPHPRMHYFEFDFGYNFKIKNLGVRPFVRYSYYRSEFTMDSLAQFTYYDFEHHRILDQVDTTYESSAVSVLYYEQNLHLPMVGTSLDISALSGRLEMSANLGFSYFAYVRDLDRHLIRRDSLQASNSGWGGPAYLLELGGKFNIYQRLWINALAGYRDYEISTGGTQHTVNVQSGESQTVTGIDTQVRGLMRRYRISFTYMFGK